MFLFLVIRFQCTLRQICDYISCGRRVSRTQSSKMRTVFSLLLLLLATAGTLTTPGYTEEIRFLATAGFVNLTENFRNEEVEICMVEELTNKDFRDLGVNTIGGRARLRAAARVWLQEYQGTREGQEAVQAREGQ